MEAGREEKVPSLCGWVMPHISMIVIPSSRACGRERDLTIRMQDHGSKQEERSRRWRVHIHAVIVFSATSEALHAHRKVPLPPSCEERIRDDSQFCKIRRFDRPDVTASS